MNDSSSHDVREHLDAVMAHRADRIRVLSVTLAVATLISPAREVFEGVGAPAEITPLLIAAAIASGAMYTPARPWPRVVALIGFACWALATIVASAADPVRGFAIMCGVVIFLAAISPSASLSRARAEERERRGLKPMPARGIPLAASAVSLLFGLEALGAAALGVTGSLAVGVMCLVPALAASLAPVRHRVERGVVLFSLVASSAPLFGVLLPDRFQLAARALGLLAVSLVFVRGLWRAWTSQHIARERQAPGVLELILLRPSRVLVISFLGICAVGTLALGLPAVTERDTISWLDAAFTAVSATCVTGLIVLDTPQDFNALGQGIILALIQLGGLGIMVFSAAAIFLTGKRLSLSHERAAVDLLGAKGRAGLARTLRAVLLVTFVTEATSALLLTLGFIAHGDGVGEAIWRGVFTSISAFCNAGFALQSASLVPYASSPFILAVIALTVIIGGLGPLVVVALLHWRDPLKRTLHAKIVLTITAFLLVAPAILFALFEWDGVLAGMSTWDRLSNAAFQSVTLRTAGFNSVDLAAVSPATWTLMLVVMFVGGSPGSTAGGIKTTTLGVLLLTVASVARGRQRVEAFGRAIPTPLILRAATVTTLAMCGAFVALLALQITQTISLDALIFELVSALATVGLSTGATGQLDEVGKIIIIACMFAGRVGPLTLFVLLSSSGGRSMSRSYPEEHVPIG